MTIVLHIGSHKTGTTAVQDFAASNRSALREAGLWYPDYTEAGLGESRVAHHHAANGIARAPLGMAPEKAAAFFDFVTRNKRPGETVLISAEPIYRQVIVPEGGHRNRLRGEAFWDAHRAYLELLRQQFATDDLKVLVVFRRQDSFAASMYQEQVKTTRYRHDFRRFIKEKKFHFNYLRHARELSEVFPQVVAEPYNRLTAGGNLIANFFALLGVEPPPVDPAKRRNESLPHELVEFKRLMNGAEISEFRRRNLERAIQYMAQRGGHKSAKKYLWMPHDEMVAFQASFEKKNRQIHEYATYDRGADFFPTDPLPPADVFPGLAPGSLLGVAARVLLPGAK